MKRDSFEQQLRDRLDGYEPQVPEDLWQEIDVRLSSDEALPQTEAARPSQAAPSGRTFRRPLWWLSAAAAVALVVVLWPSDDIISDGNPTQQPVAVNDTLSAPSDTRLSDGRSPSDTRLSDGRTPSDTRLSDNGSPSDTRPLTPPPGSPVWRGRATSNLEGERSYLSNSDTPNNVSSSRSNLVSQSNVASSGSNLVSHSDVTSSGSNLVSHSDVTSSGSNLVSHSDVASTDSPSKLEGDGGRVSQLSQQPQLSQPSDTLSVTSRDNPVPHLAQDNLPQLVPPSFGGGPGEASPGEAYQLSLFASNAFGHGGDASAVYMNPVLANSYYQAYENAPSHNHAMAPRYELVGYQETVDHHRPVQVGLSVSFPLSGRWAIQTGLTYSWLTSDFSHIMPSTTITDHQSLQYLGVPLNVAYRVWSSGSFSVYAAVGGAVLFNTLARVSTDGIEKPLRHDRLQWSASAVVGAEYAFLRSWSLYVEPGLTYYPDNGSDIENFFKDKPLNGSLQMGFRYRFGK